MIKIMTEDKNFTLKVSKEESDRLFNQLALILLGHEATEEPITPSPAPVKLPNKELKPKSYTKPHYKPSYKGFLYLKCKHCETVKGFCSKYPMDYYKCDECGEETDLSEEIMIPMYTKCINCGSKFKYTTNIQDDEILYTCISCESPVDLVYNERRNQYNSLDDK